MEHYDFQYGRGRRLTFDQVPESARRRVFGVDYAHTRGFQGGDLYLTRVGWSYRDSLLPRHWYDNEGFRKFGRALKGGTGKVYRVPVPHPALDPIAVVVKFCRFGQDLGLTGLDMPAVFPWPIELLEGATFLGPFAEFGRVNDLLRVRHEMRQPWFAMKQPLAIYCPPTRFSLWQVGRDPNRLWEHSVPLARDQAGAGDQAVAYDWERIYIMLYRWMGGADAELAQSKGWITEAEMVALAHRSARDLAALGFAVLDHKPRHVILRMGPKGLARRGGQPVYGLIDYELLVPFTGALAGSGI